LGSAACIMHWCCKEILKMIKIIEGRC
jgi:hypothetical protein